MKPAEGEAKKICDTNNGKRQRSGTETEIVKYTNVRLV